MTALDMAVDFYTKLIDNNQLAKPLTPEWYVRQGAGHALSMFNRIKVEGAEGDFAAIETLRRKMKSEATT